MRCDTSPFIIDRKSQVRKILKLTAASDSKVGNVLAIAEDGTLVAYSATGSELVPYASMAGKVILVDSQKIVPVLDTAFGRFVNKPYIEMLPYFGKRIMGYIHRQDLDHRAESVSDRTNIIMVREPIGIYVESKL